MGWLSKVFGIDSRRNKERDAAEAAAKAEEARVQAEGVAAGVAKQNAEYQQSLLNMQRESMNLQANNSTDLLNSNVSNVVAGGTAEQAAATELKKKKVAGTGVSSTLGINV